MPPKCVVVEVWCCISAAITVADSTITIYKEAQAMTDGVITVVQDGCAIGDVFKCNPTVYTEFDGVDDYLKVISAGDSTTASVGQITIIAMME